MIVDKLARERDINEILGRLENKIKKCRTGAGKYMLEDLEYELTEELKEIQGWLADYQ